MAGDGRGDEAGRRPALHGADVPRPHQSEGALLADHADLRAGHRADATGGAGLRDVFVVNQAPEILDVMRELLEDERYHVTTTTFAAQQTFAQIAALQPSLLVVDLAIGQQGGWDLLNEIQGHGRTCDIPVVVVSTDSRLLDRAKDAHGHQNARRFVVKPFDLEAILATIQELIGPA